MVIDQVNIGCGIGLCVVAKNKPPVSGNSKAPASFPISPERVNFPSRKTAELLNIPGRLKRSKVSPACPPSRAVLLWRCHLCRVPEAPDAQSRRPAFHACDYYVRYHRTASSGGGKMLAPRSRIRLLPLKEPAWRIARHSRAPAFLSSLADGSAKLHRPAAMCSRGLCLRPAEGYLGLALFLRPISSR